MQTTGTPPRSPKDEEKHRREMRRFYRSAAFFLQIGWSVITPIVLFPLLGNWLSNRFSLGLWPIIVGVVLGFLTAAATFVRMFRTLLAPTLTDDEDADAASAADPSAADAEKNRARTETEPVPPPAMKHTPAATAAKTPPAPAQDGHPAAETAEKTVPPAAGRENTSADTEAPAGTPPSATADEAVPGNTDRKEMRP